VEELTCGHVRSVARPDRSSALQSTLRIGPRGRTVNSQDFDAVEEGDTPAAARSDLVIAKPEGRWV
jgi:hypothetical protein